MPLGLKRLAAKGFRAVLPSRLTLGLALAHFGLARRGCTVRRRSFAFPRRIVAFPYDRWNWLWRRLGALHCQRALLRRGRALRGRGCGLLRGRLRPRRWSLRTCSLRPAAVQLPHARASEPEQPVKQSGSDRDKDEVMQQQKQDVRERPQKADDKSSSRSNSFGHNRKLPSPGALDHSQANWPLQGT